MQIIVFFFFVTITTSAYTTIYWYNISHDVNTYIYKQGTSVRMCCAVTKKQKH